MSSLFDKKIALRAISSLSNPIQNSFETDTSRPFADGIQLTRSVILEKGAQINGVWAWGMQIFLRA